MNRNSTMAYQSLLLDGTISNQQKAILDLLSDGVARTSRQLAKALDMERTSVCGRITKLKEVNLVVVSENKACPTTGKTVEWYGVGR